MQAGQRVRLIHDPNRIGVLTGKTFARAGTTRWQVQFPDTADFIPEDQLELVPESPEHPVELLERGLLGSAADLLRTLTHVRLTGRLANVLYSMDMTGTDFYAYQFKPLVKLLQSPSTGILMADEVGLEHEFFATETLGGITDVLVREAIQNSLDAASDEKVRVRFILNRADIEARRLYLDDLWPHLEASRDSNTVLPARTEPFRFLAVEDEGTRGLEGDPRQDEDDTQTNTKNDFYYFWRNVVRSRKETVERGRWGLGKTVFAFASRLNAFFGLTYRRSDRRTLLMGQSVLKIHRIEGKRYRPYGYYGLHEGGLTLPIGNLPEWQEFARRFGLRRRGPGLSVVIPYPDEEITGEVLVESVLRHYFYPLLEGKLEVEIEEGAGVSVVLHSECLEREIQRNTGLSHLLSLVKLARWGLSPEGESIATLALPPAGRAPRLTEELFGPADLERLRRRYDNAQRIALDVRLWIEAIGNSPRETKFRLLIERDAEDQKTEGHFVRQGITVENPKARRPRGVRWIVVVNDGILSAFLGDAENPAHTEWQRSSPKFKAKYLRGPSTLDFVRAVPMNIESILSRPSLGRDPDLLRNIFSLPKDSTGPAPVRRQPSEDGDEESTPEEIILGGPGSNQALLLSRVRTGFRLRGKAGKEVPRRLEVIAAYDVLRGNPFQRYSPLDFRMDRSIAVQLSGSRVVSRHDNRLELEIESPEFEVLVTRFDEKRDLRVKVRPIQEAG